MLNIDFVREVTLKTSSFGAEFDNALSGVLIFDQRYGNDQIKKIIKLELVLVKQDLL